MTMLDRAIVVGVDGSESGMAAVRWAGTEARRLHAPVHVVAVYPWPVPAYPDGLVATTTLREALAKTAAESAGEAAAALGGDVTQEIVSGSPASVLLARASSARMVVLGSRGLGGFSGLLVGSTAVAVAAHAPCPVVVVRGDAEAARGPVVVGVDGSPVSERAIAFAFEEASARGSGLRAVLAWSDWPIEAMLNEGYGSLYLDTYVDEAQELLAQRLAGWCEKYPDVEVTRVVRRSRPAKLLRHESEDACLVVVGSRGRGGFAGLTMGSVSQALLHHSACPVAVVRADD